MGGWAVLQMTQLWVWVGELGIGEKSCLVPPATQPCGQMGPAAGLWISVSRVGSSAPRSCQHGPGTGVWGLGSHLHHHPGSCQCHRSLTLTSDPHISRDYFEETQKKLTPLVKKARTDLTKLFGLFVEFTPQTDAQPTAAAR